MKFKLFTEDKNFIFTDRLNNDITCGRFKPAAMRIAERKKEHFAPFFVE
ncbi:MAG: hypothetical protein JJU28_00815 [Cyclobacteriaceae bacterium]|nr:hypothetical protein [Cyclobacteriaceae bacterium]